MFNKNNLIKTFIVSLFALSAFSVNAASLYFMPQEVSLNRGQEVVLDLKVNTNDNYINASQASVKFPVDILKFEGLDKSGSLFNFWLEDPAVSETDTGMVKFSAGTPKGFSGSSLQIVKLRFTAVGSGVAEIGITDALVTANDGKGTNVLSETKGAVVNVGVKSTFPSVSAIVVEKGATPVIAEEPQKVEREAVLVTGEKLPAKPELRIPLYPDQTKWYGVLGEAAVFWNLPDDVSGVAVKVDRSPNTKPREAEAGLFTGKKFTVSDEGVWYAHVRFRNNVGWGETSHHKISVDTSAPASFEIAMDNTATDNPTPKISFDTKDSFSGVASAMIYVDQSDPVKTASSTMILPIQAPGKHLLKVRVFDAAGNGVEDDQEFEILPLPTPTLTYLTDKAGVGQAVFVSGKASSNVFVDVKILDIEKKEVFKKTISSDAVGKWETEIKNELLVSGDYELIATSHDARGAISFSSESKPIVITSKPIISVGSVEFSSVQLFIFIILLVGAVGGLGGWQYSSKRKKREAYNIIAGRDLVKLTELIEGDMDELEASYRESKEVAQTVKTNIDYRASRVRITLEKMKKYIGKEVEKIK